MDSILTQLNAQQKRAVTSEAQHLLILAGAGSGKTRVLTSRVAWCSQVHHQPISSMMVVTFTNKAAKEIRERIESSLSVRHGLFGTFHSIGYRMLQQHSDLFGLTPNFQVLDSDDQQRLIKQVISEKWNEDYYNPKELALAINRLKEKGIRAHQAVPSFQLRDDVVEFYKLYEKRLNENNVVDFPELILRSYEGMQSNETFAQYYRDRIKHIFIDEFQDTNDLQYKWMQAFAGLDAQITVVGDDDQSIYAWRGANASHLRGFAQDYQSTAEVIHLDQNYRSTQIILDAANAIVSSVSGRMDKTLWSETKQGQKIELSAYNDERQEASSVVNSILALYRRGVKLSDIAVLYRTHSQSRLFEEMCISRGLSYRLFGSLRFAERAEIKNVVAYARLALNHNDNVAFARVINTPTRGIGNVTVAKIRQHALDGDMSYFDAAEQMVHSGELSGRAKSSVERFLVMICTIGHRLDRISSIEESLRIVVTDSGLADFYREQKLTKDIDKTANLEELIHAGQEADATDATLVDFLANLMLDGNPDDVESQNEYVSLMTIHAAKGLEFEAVFVVGMEEGILPHQISIDEGDIDEEKRLCYVALTRAKKRLSLSFANTRYHYGRHEQQEASRFLRDIPDALLSGADVLRSPKERTETTYQRGASGFYVGKSVSHKQFGDGVVVGMSVDTEPMLEILFFKHDTKHILLSDNGLCK